MGNATLIHLISVLVLTSCRSGFIIVNILVQLLGHKLISVLVLTSHSNDSTLLGSTLKSCIVVDVWQNNGVIPPAIYYCKYESIQVFVTWKIFGLLNSPCIVERCVPWKSILSIIPKPTIVIFLCTYKSQQNIHQA